MTQLTTRGDQRRRSALARLPPAQDRRRPLAAVLADPRVRLGAGTAVVLVTAWAAAITLAGAPEQAHAGRPCGPKVPPP